jgi:gliding motility-associated-like protein
MEKILSILSFIIVCFEVSSQNVWLNPNNGQWDKEIEYSVDISNGHLYIDQKGFTYSLNNAMDHHHDIEEHSAQEDNKIQCQVITAHFENSTWKGIKKEENPSSFYRNYFIGNDKNRWKSSVFSVQQSTMIDFYDGIDLVLNGETDKLKYSFVVKPGIDVSLIDYSINGSDNVSLVDGALHISTRFGEIIEEKPSAWTEKEGRKTKVPVEFILENGHVKFSFPKGYNKNETLVIDPYLVFSSFSGSTADNWGMTATPDTQGNLYAGGIVFSNGGIYPTVTGSFDVSLNGGDTYTYPFGGGTYSMSGFDCAISKFNSTGTTLLFSTYLGGTGNEAPHSLVTDQNNNLYVFGVTGSGNFPTIAGGYDVSFNGGPFVAENELGYYGADIYVTRFNAAGSSLVASTFVGGSGTDGINIGALNYNYGDPFRGEIIVENGFVYVTSSTQSADFPNVGASQGFLNGTQDAVVFKMNSLLTSMSWSTYFGGSGFESGNSIQLASNGNVYVAGGTNSNNITFPSGNDLTFNGGVADGYLLKLQGGTAALMAGTYMGMTEYDQAYFVQLDNLNEVYVYGQSESAWPISAGVYGNVNSGQFIRKYSNNLSTINWTTMIGASTGHAEISPTAFLVSDCFDIYISGWGGTINSSYSNQASYSSSNGFPLTPDAYQSVTTGSNFYIAVLDQDAAYLKYATYMGGTSSSSNHVDGGTSRFDKSGRIYHAVCGACGGQDYGFTSTPGVWSPANQSSNCNLAAFKFELSTIDAVVAAPDPLICLPDPVIFNNNSANGNAFYWDFGDGTSSTAINPSHLYSGAGDYTVTLVVIDTNGCFSPDSIEFLINIGDFQGGIVVPSDAICPGVPYQLEAYGGATYSWTPANVLDNPISSTPIATVNSTTVFTVIVSDSCGADTLQVTLVVYPFNPSISGDTSICIGNSVGISASGGGSYLWSPSSTLDNPTSATPIATPEINTIYSVIITSVDGCVSYDSLLVNVFYTPPIPVIPDSVQMCLGSSVGITVSGGDSYYWSPNYEINQLTGPNVIVSPAMDFTYYCDFINACGAVLDSVLVEVIQAKIIAGNDTIICPGENALLWANGGVSYTWSPSISINNSSASEVIATPTAPTIYVVIGIDEYGCSDTDSVNVGLFPQPFIQSSPDVYAIYGDVIQLTATSLTSGIYFWSPAEYLSCVSCSSPIATPPQDITYTVSYTDENGCSASDIVSVYFSPLLYIPNTFTPDGNEFNNGFKIVASNIKSYELIIFNRWGEVIFTMNDFDDYWDGTYKGIRCQDGTYTWKINYEDFKTKKYEQKGHINLLR